MTTVEDILYAHDLRNTGCRKFILSELLKCDTALSENELKGPYPDLFDRVTFYRTLKTLEEKEIIHRIVLNDNTVKYALNRHHHDYNEMHSHHCEKCDEVLRRMKTKSAEPRKILLNARCNGDRRLVPTA